MRTTWAAGAAMVTCLALGGAPALAQDASPPGGPPSTASPAATPGPVAWVTGTATCPTLDLGDFHIDAEGVGHWRSGRVRCITSTDDVRVSGTHTSTDWQADWWGDMAAPRGQLVQWATVRLENDGGAWEGRLTGVASVPDVGDIIEIWYTGTGGYAGLSYFEQWTEADPWQLQGLIFPGDPPTP
jgi:hypothetical protein